MFQVIKRFSGYSTAHRLWKADSHCRFVHGYDRTFDITFGCHNLDSNGWVIDFGGLKHVDKTISDLFDHRLCLAKDDPLLNDFKLLERLGGCQLTIMDHPGMEGAAETVHDIAQAWLDIEHDGRVFVVEVVARENEKNSVVFIPPTVSTP